MSTTEPTITPLARAMSPDSPKNPKKNWFKCRVLLALIILSTIPTFLLIAVIFLGSDGHNLIDRFPHGEDGVGFPA